MEIFVDSIPEEGKTLNLDSEKETWLLYRNFLKKWSGHESQNWYDS
ncbi:MAG: hypothetical protein ABIE74_12935 [Pseudomonadota bacterium]